MPRRCLTWENFLVATKVRESIEGQSGGTQSHPRSLQTKESSWSSDGARIKQKRLERGWSVRHLSAHSGLAISTISKIENNKMVPTVDLFSRLLAALQTTPGDWFFETAQAAEAVKDVKPFVTVTRGGGQKKSDHPSIRREVLLGDAEHKDIVIMRQLFPAHIEETDRKLVGHLGNEVVFVVRGTLQMSFKGRKKVLLNPGDSLHFSSAIPHLYESHGGSECEIIMVWRKND